MAHPAAGVHRNSLHITGVGGWLQKMLTGLDWAAHHWRYLIGVIWGLKERPIPPLAAKNQSVYNLSLGITHATSFTQIHTVYPP